MVGDITGRKRRERELLEISERERQRIGQDLHDGLGQHLHGLSYLAALLETGLREDGSVRVPAVAKLNQYLTEALELTRSFAHGLQPVAPTPEGLMLALQHLVDRTNRLYGVQCRCRCDGPVLIEVHNVATHLYRIAQEAVTNAMKHGRTTRIQITLSASSGRLALVIRDNGRGIKRSTGQARGMGLHIMRYRADAIAGVLTVRRHPRGGTEITCTVALPKLGRNEDLNR